MGLTITKQKPAVKPKLEKVEAIAPAEMDFEQLADEYGALDATIQTIMQNPAFARFELVKKALQSKLEGEVEPQDAVEITGKCFLLEVGAAAKEARSIGDLALTRKFMGDQTFMACAKVTLKDAEAYLTPEQLAKVLEPEGGYTKRRKITAKPLV